MNTSPDKTKHVSIVSRVTADVDVHVMHAMSSIVMYPTYYNIADDTDIVHCNIHHDVIIHDEIVVVNCIDCQPNDTHSMQL